MKKPLLLYVVYGPNEKEYFEILNTHLAFTKRNGEIVVWARSEIAPGQEKQREICSKYVFLGNQQSSPAECREGKGGREGNAIKLLIETARSIHMTEADG